MKQKNETKFTNKIHKNRTILLFLCALLFLPVQNLIAKTFDVSFVYCQSNCSDSSTTSKFVTAKTGNKVMPYASLKFSFDTALTLTEKSEFIANLRLTHSDGSQVQHLHERFPEIPAEGKFASFLEQNSNTLIYTAASLLPGATYNLSYPINWAEKSNLNSFETLALTGDKLRIYEVSCLDTTCFEEIAHDESGGNGFDRKYKNIVFKDVFNDKTYLETKMKIRGFYSSWFDKKGYTVDFDSDELFEGFLDESGVYQGAREKIKFGSQKAGNTTNLSTNKLMMDLARKLEKRILGAALATDSYFAILTINGRFWGVYNTSEHINTGKGGWSKMKDRVEGLGFNDKGKGMLHKIIWPMNIGSVDVGSGYSIEPKTDHEYKFTQRGDGVTTSWIEDIPYKIHYDYSRATNSNAMIDFEIKVKKPKMKLEANEHSFVVPNFFSLKGNGSGSVEINHLFSKVTINFDQAVQNKKKVEAKFNTAFDFRIYTNNIQNNPNLETVKKWIHTNSSLISMFLFRITASWDNGEQNRFMFSKETDLEKFRAALTAPDGNKYYDVPWDGDLSFQHSCYPNFIIANCTRGITKHFKMLAESLEGRQNYVNLFTQETKAGGVLTSEFYQKQIDNHLKMLGNAVSLENLRWNRTLKYNSLRRYINDRFGNAQTIQNKMLSLDIDNYIAPNSKTIYPQNGIDMTADFVKSQLDEVYDLTLAVENGRWTRYITLPTIGIQEGKILKVARYAALWTEVRTGITSIRLNANTVTQFTFTNGKWITNSTQTVYARNGVDMTTDFVKSQLDVINNLTLAVEDGNRWARYINLPMSGIEEGRRLKVARYSTYWTEVRTGITSIRLEPNKVALFIFTNGKWKAVNSKKTVYPQNGVDMTADFVKLQLDVIDDLTLAVEDGNRWARYINLPTVGIEEGRRLKVARYSTYWTEVKTGITSIRLEPNKVALFIFTNGKWKAVNSKKTVYPQNGVDMTADFIKSQLDVIDDLTLAVANARWVRYIDLPTSGIEEGRTLKVARYSGWWTAVRTGATSIRLARNTVTSFAFINGKWTKTATNS